MQGYVGPLIVSQADGPALSGSTTPTSLLQNQGKYVFGAGQIANIGQRFVARALCRLSSAASTPGNLTLDLRYGSTVIATTQALALATSQTNITLRLELELICRAVGASASFMVGGEVKSASLTGGPLILVPASAPVVGNTFDSSQAGALDFFGTFSASSGSNSITCHGFSLESFN